MELLRKTSALVVMLMLTCTALPTLSAADSLPDPCDIDPLSEECADLPPPAGIDLSATTPMDTSVSIQLESNFSTAAPITYTITTPPEHGALSAIGPTGIVVYTPEASSTESDLFKYKSTKGNRSSGRGTVSITIGTSPADTTAPVFTLPIADHYFATTTIPAFPTLTTPAATDDSGVAPTITSNAPASFPVGTTTVTWTATDAAGNHSSITSDVGITLVDQYRISSDKAAATTTESFTATALSFDGTSAYIPAVGETIGVVLSSSTSTAITTAVADALGQATFTIPTAGSYLIGLDANQYATTTPITITEVIPDPIPTPTPVVASGGGNGPPVAQGPVYTTPAAPVAPAPTSTAAPAFVYSDAAAGVLTPTPVTTTTPAPTPVAVAPQPKVLAAETHPASPEPTPTVETTPAEAQPLAVAQSAAAATSVTDNSLYELLGLAIVLLALAGLIWQWKKRRER